MELDGRSGSRQHGRIDTAATSPRLRLRGFNKRALKRSPHKSALPMLREAKAMDAALEVLTDAAWIRHIGTRDGDNPGRGGGDYSVNPAVHGRGQ
ncbi:MAG: hypothetical protein KGK11_02385 [Sphingomonadales bacterium]|nr:hypothetical protein [Sphingomonadales bacterium]